MLFILYTYIMAIDLTKKLIQQITDIESSFDITPYTAFVDAVSEAEQNIPIGNTKQYIQLGLGVVGTTNFNHLAATETVKLAERGIYDSVSLDNDTYKNECTVNTTELLTAFLSSDALDSLSNEWVANSRIALKLKQAELFISDFSSLITNAPASIKVTGTATDTLTSLTEINNICADLKWGSKNYTYGQVTNIRNAKPDAFVAIMSEKTVNTMKSLVASGLFNADYWLEQAFVNPKSIVAAPLGTITETPITDSEFSNISIASTQLIDDTTIVLVERRAYKRLQQINVSYNEFYPKGLNIQYYSHSKTGRKFLNWGLMLIYQNPNLNITTVS